MARTAAWQRKEGKSPSGGLNKKGRASYKKGTHVTKEGKTAKKGLWYNIHQKRK